mmetsp:Transcript_40746/g.53455  ORF Transcript_40746/g.53455 Transcript_40746/m.53455 type:complete len:205 (-) Transcript_40746:436-1050(-)
MNKLDNTGHALLRCLHIQMVRAVARLEDFAFDLTTVDQAIAYVAIDPVKLAVHECHGDTSEGWQVIFELLRHVDEGPDHLAHHQLTALLPNHHLVDIICQVFNLLFVENIIVKSAPHTAADAGAAQTTTRHAIPIKRREGRLCQHSIGEIGPVRRQARILDTLLEILDVSPVWGASDAHGRHENESLHLLWVFKSVPSGEHAAH